MKKVEEALETVKKALTEENAEKIKTSMEALQQAAFKIGEAMYKASTAGTAGNADPTGAGAETPGAETPGSGDGKESGKKDDNVVDAEFEETR